MAVSTDAPVAKRAPSAYWIWLGENRAEIVKALNGVAKGSEVSKKGGEMWKALSEEAKAPYEQKAKEAKAALPPKPEKKKTPTGPEARKKPMTPVFAYIQENRESIQAQGAKSLGEISKKGAELYKALSEDEKKRRQSTFEEAMKSFNEWKTSDEGRAAMTGKKELMQEKKAAQQEKVEKKEAKAYRKATKEAKAAGLPPPEAPKAKSPSPTKEPKKTTIETPTKRGRGSPVGERPAKRGRGQGGKPAAPEGAVVEESVLDKARHCGYEAALRNLANRPDVIAAGKSSNDMLEALQKSEGLVNPAKRALLGGA